MDTVKIVVVMQSVLALKPIMADGKKGAIRHVAEEVKEFCSSASTHGLGYFFRSSCI